jgi:hypothetical protein
MAEEINTRRSATKARGERGSNSSSKSQSQDNGSHPGSGRSRRTQQRSRSEKPGSRAGKGGRSRGQRADGTQRRQESVLSRGANGVKSAGSTAVDAVKENPVPAALISAGVAWLLVQSAGRRYPHVGKAVTRNTRVAFSTVGEGVSSATGTVREALSSTAETMKDGASTVGEYTLSGLSAVGGAIGSGASAVGQGAKKGVTATRDAVVTSWQNHPVLTSAAALAAGLAVAMMLPGTAPERKAMGKRSAATTGRAKSAAREFL